MLHTRILVATVLLASASGLCGQSRTPTQYVRNDPLWANQGGFGRTVKGLGDFDGDGFADYAVSAPNWPSGSFVGRVYVYSGRTGTVWQTFDGSQPSAGFGLTLADVGDADGDGTRDLAIGSPEYDVPGGGANHGRVQVFSGATGAVLWTMDGGNSNSQLGKAMEATGMPTSGPHTLVVTQPVWTSPTTVGAGRVLFIDAASGVLTDWAAGIIVFGGLGQRLAAQPDLSGIYAVASNGSVWSVGPGVGGGTGTVSLAYSPPAGAGGFPSVALLAGPSSGSRVAVAWPNADTNGFTNNGVINVYPVGSQTSVVSIHGNFSSAFLGGTIARTHDVDGDGVEELVAIASGPTFVAPNEIRVYDQNGVVVDEAIRAGANSSSLSSIPDVTGDGRGEWFNGIGTGSTTTFECTMFSKGLSLASETNLGPGTLWTFSLDAGPTLANAPYVQGYSLSGAHPGTPLAAPSPLIPLNFDTLSSFAFALAGSPFFPDLTGTLDASGTATTTLYLPMSVTTALIGMDITTTYVTLTGSSVNFAANPVTLSF